MTQTHVDLQSRLLQCAGGTAVCESISEYVVHGIRPGATGRRTDLLLFGVCAAHHAELNGLEAMFATDGYVFVAVVEWSGLGQLLEELELAGFKL